ncbi:uncharacterized protein METZ01_LOCUS253246 [marine metagenome]|uniref:Uncharacterized protein n=1 Tax=marine metagenome TaxID=408172 RepID=A0A382IMA9_9ZZZZ
MTNFVSLLPKIGRMRGFEGMVP